MKVITQQFHKDLIKNQRLKLFSHLRKELYEFHQFKILYEQLIENNQSLQLLITKSGIFTFYKYIIEVINDKFYHKITQNQIFFNKNLKIISILIQTQIFNQNKINFVIFGLSNLLLQNKKQIYISQLQEIFQITELIIQSKKYSEHCFEVIQHYKLIKCLYDIVFEKQTNQYFFKIIFMVKTIANPLITQLTIEQLINCLQIHILTSNITGQLYVSYGFLAELFPIAYNNKSQLYQYGSILNKAFQDLSIHGLTEPISYFLLRGVQNQSIVKLIIDMNLMEVLFKFVIKNCCKRINLETYCQQSILVIFCKIVEKIKKQDLQVILQRFNCELIVSEQRYQQNLNQVKRNTSQQIEINRFLNEISKITSLEYSISDIFRKYLIKQNKENQFSFDI